jgi:hypothetical protein
MDSLVVQGMAVDTARLDWLRGWIRENFNWSRKRLAQALCVRWDWRNERGQLKDFAARSFLLKLETQGWIDLPPLQTQKRRMRPPVAELAEWERPPALESSLRELRPIRLQLVQAGTTEAKRWAYLLDRYHYLGLRLVGENAGYLAYDCHGREVACLLFGAPAWRCAARDLFLQWSSCERAARLKFVANNTRFLILPWVRVSHLASHVLGQAAGRISQDWQCKYGHGLEWLESFVDSSRYRGTCYQAANWQYVGHTTGRSRQDRAHTLQVPRKAVYLYRLRP